MGLKLSLAGSVASRVCSFPGPWRRARALCRCACPLPNAGVSQSRGPKRARSFAALCRRSQIVRPCTGALDHCPVQVFPNCAALCGRAHPLPCAGVPKACSPVRARYAAALCRRFSNRSALRRHAPPLPCAGVSKITRPCAGALVRCPVQAFPKAFGPAGILVRCPLQAFPNRVALSGPAGPLPCAGIVQSVRPCVGMLAVLFRWAALRGSTPYRLELRRSPTKKLHPRCRVMAAARPRPATPSPMQGNDRCTPSWGRLHPRCRVMTAARPRGGDSIPDAG